MNVPINLALALRAAPPCMSVRALEQGAEGLARSTLALLLHYDWMWHYKGSPPRCPPQELMPDAFAAFCADLQAFLEYPQHLLEDAEAECFEFGPERAWSRIWPLFAIRLRGAYPALEEGVLPLLAWSHALHVDPCFGPRCACCMPFVASGNIARNTVAVMLSRHPGALRFRQSSYGTTAELATWLLECLPQAQLQLEGPPHVQDILEAHATLDALRPMPAVAMGDTLGRRMCRDVVPAVHPLSPLTRFWRRLAELRAGPE